jgi:hypothetical protein
MVEWKDVTSEYAGVFFRAEGGRSAAFGTIQEEGCPQLTSVKTNWGEYKDENDNWKKIPEINIIPNQWSKFITTGSDKSTYLISFRSNSSEVRPRNMAIRIWKRTG